MARTEEGVALLMEKASELEKLKKLVWELAEDNGFSLPGESYGYYGDDVYKDWNDSSCYGEDPKETFGVHSDGTIWYPSSC